MRDFHGRDFVVEKDPWNSHRSMAGHICRSALAAVAGFESLTAVLISTGHVAFLEITLVTRNRVLMRGDIVAVEIDKAGRDDL